MEKIAVLVDTDIFIDYFNIGSFSNILENKKIIVYFSIVTEKELLSKQGLSTSEREAITYTLKMFRRISLDNMITGKYSIIQNLHPNMDKEDALIAATAIVKRLPLITRNYKHYKKIDELILIDTVEKFF